MQRGGAPGHRTPPALPSTPSASPPRSRRASPGRGRARDDERRPRAGSTPRAPSSAALRELLQKAAGKVVSGGKAAAAAAAGRGASAAPSPLGPSPAASSSPEGSAGADERGAEGFRVSPPKRGGGGWWPMTGALLTVLLVALLAGLGLLALVSSRAGPYSVVLSGSVGGRASRLSRLQHIAFPERGRARTGTSTGTAHVWEHGAEYGGAAGEDAADEQASVCWDHGQWPLRTLEFPAGGFLGDVSSFPVCHWDDGAAAAPGGGRVSVPVMLGLVSGSGSAPSDAANVSAPAPGGEGVGAPAAADPGPDPAVAAASAPREAPAAAAGRACGAALGVPQVPCGPPLFCDNAAERLK